MLWNGLKPDIYYVPLLSFYCERNELVKFSLISRSASHGSFQSQSFSSCFASHDSFLQGFASVASWSLCLAFVWNKIDWLRPQKIDITNYKMHPWQRWLDGFVDCHAGWLTSLRIGNRFDYFQNLSFFMTTFCNLLIENQPGCEGLLLNDIEMFANLREFKYEKR